MTEPTIIPTPATASRPAAARDRRVAGTIDLRFPEAQWTYRQLQARVSHARDRLAEAEADAAVRAPRAADEQFEMDVNAALVAVPDLIAREWSETARTVEARSAAADLEVRRILETARAEADALVEEAEFLRSHPVAGLGDPSAPGVVDDSGAAFPDDRGTASW